MIYRVSRSASARPGAPRCAGADGRGLAGCQQGLAARGQSLPSPKRAEPARLLRCSSVKYVKYSPSSRLAAGPAAPISARSDFVHGLLGGALDLAGAGGAERVAERDGAAVDVDPVRREAELADAVEGLRGECLVQLVDVDV